jgi:hypothetical protein
MADELKAEYWEVSAKKGASAVPLHERSLTPSLTASSPPPNADHNVNELFDRVAAALFEQSILKAEAKKNPTINLPSSSSSSSRTDSAISDRYVGACPLCPISTTTTNRHSPLARVRTTEKSFESSKQNGAQATNQGYCCW